MKYFYYISILFISFFSFKNKIYSINFDNTVISKPKAVTADFDINNANATYCIGDTVKFTNKSSEYNIIHWSFGDNYESYKENPEHKYFKAGLVTVTLTAIAVDGTKATKTVDLTIREIPSVEIKNATDTVFYEGGSVSLTAEGDVYSSVLWTTSETSETIIATLAGKYVVTVTNENGCTNTDTITVVVKTSVDGAGGIVIKNNIITPNGDGINDYLYIDGMELTDVYELNIYNRWGNLVFTTEKYANNWTGTSSNGKPLDAGTYYFVIKGVGKKGKAGYVDIIK